MLVAISLARMEVQTICRFYCTSAAASGVSAVGTTVERLRASAGRAAVCGASTEGVPQSGESGGVDVLSFFVGAAVPA